MIIEDIGAIEVLSLLLLLLHTVLGQKGNNRAVSSG